MKTRRGAIEPPKVSHDGPVASNPTTTPAPSAPSQQRAGEAGGRGASVDSGAVRSAARPRNTLAAGVQALLHAHRAKASPLRSVRIRFSGVGDKDVYNPTAPFTFGAGKSQRTVMAARVESRHSETDTETVFFERRGEVWEPATGLERLRLQDPFVSKIGDQIVVGGVQVSPKEGGAPGELAWKTVFYTSSDLVDFSHLATGPLGMKDIRPVSLADGRIGVFTRPQGTLASSLGAAGERGSVGFVIIDTLSELSAATLSAAPLLADQPPASEWWGINAARLLPGGELKVLGHVARFDETGDRHYYPITFRFDPLTRRSRDLCLLVERSQLGPLGESKRPDLTDVLFSGGLDGNTLYVGAGDAEVYAISVA